MSAAIPVWLIVTAIWLAACYFTMRANRGSGHWADFTEIGGCLLCLLWTIFYLIYWIAVLVFGGLHAR